MRFGIFIVTSGYCAGRPATNLSHLFITKPFALSSQMPEILVTLPTLVSSSGRRAWGFPTASIGGSIGAALESGGS